MSTQRKDGTALAPERASTEPPPLYKVILLNDDFTPMDFVIEVLLSFFDMNQEQATRIMLKVHTEGSGLCGIFSKDIAASKVALVADFARLNQHPLACVMEEDK